MIVLDASALLELLRGGKASRRIAERVLRPDLSVHAPHLVGVEVAHVLRRLARSGDLDDVRAREALDVYDALPIERHAHEPLLPRIWQLRHNLTAYDASYIALAEGLDAPLVTCDERLAEAPGHGAVVEVV